MKFKIIKDFGFPLLFLSLFLVFSFFILEQFKKKGTFSENSYKAYIADKEIILEIADTPQKIAKGLSKRNSLNENRGMLFILNSDTRPYFWMKDMNFAIDILWIDKFNIVGIEKNVQPEPGKLDSELTLYQPPSPIDMVLEVNAGFAEKNGIKVGDRIRLNFKN